MRVFDNAGGFLGELPPDAKRVNSSLLALTGKYVDSDGIIYDADGTINEPATAAYAREVAMQRTAAPYYDYSTVEAMRETKQESIQENSNADATRAYLDAMFDAVYYTAADAPVYITEGVKKAFHVGQWVTIGLLAAAAIMALDKLPSQGNVKRYAQRKVKETRKRIAKRIAG